MIGDSLQNQGFAGWPTGTSAFSACNSLSVYAAKVQTYEYKDTRSMTDASESCACSNETERVIPLIPWFV